VNWHFSIFIIFAKSLAHSSGHNTVTYSPDKIVPGPVCSHPEMHTLPVTYPHNTARIAWFNRLAPTKNTIQLNLQTQRPPTAAMELGRLNDQMVDFWANKLPLTVTV
jgi:hypothetical protein